MLYTFTREERRAASSERSHKSIVVGLVRRDDKQFGPFHKAELSELVGKTVERVVESSWHLLHQRFHGRVVRHFVFDRQCRDDERQH